MTLANDNSPTPEACFQELRPALDHITELMRTAPLDRTKRAGLELLVTAYFFSRFVATTGFDPDDAYALIRVGFEPPNDPGPNGKDAA